MVITELRSIRKHLEMECTRLRRDMKAAEGQRYSEELNRLPTERVEAAMQTLERNKQLVLTSHLRERLVEVERALEKLDNGTYGRCDSCEEFIPPERLQTLPQAVLCIRCKNIQGKIRQRQCQPAS